MISSATERVFENGALNTGTPCRFACARVDLVGADAERADREQPACLVEHLRRDLRLAADAEHVDVAHARGELGLGQRALHGLDVKAVGRERFGLATGWMFSSSRILISDFGNDVAAMWHATLSGLESPAWQRRRRDEAAPKKPTTPRKKKVKAEAGSVGLTADEVASGSPPAEIGKLRGQIEAAGGHVLAAYREPFGGHWVALAALPLDKVKPTPYQRELSKAHADRLADVIPKVGRFLDPVIAVPDGDGFISPNGMHRLAAIGQLGAKTVVALVMPEPEIAFRILALNTEKAHNLKDKALEVIRMARAIADDGKRSETDVAFELEQASLVTIGVVLREEPAVLGRRVQLGRHQVRVVLDRADDEEPEAARGARRQAARARRGGRPPRSSSSRRRAGRAAT